MLRWFKKKRTPIPGEVWSLKDYSPWPNPKYSVKILDVKDDWVRYYISPISSDERLKLSTFLSVYEVVEDA